MVIGMKALAISSSESSGEDLIEKPGKISMALTLLVALIFSIGIFFLLPLYLSEIYDKKFQNELISNIIEGFFKLSFSSARKTVPTRISTFKKSE